MLPPPWTQPQLAAGFRVCSPLKQIIKVPIRVILGLYGDNGKENGNYYHEVI